MSVSASQITGKSTFVQHFVQASIKVNTKALRDWPFVLGEFPSPKDLSRGYRFHVMGSLCKRWGGAGLWFEVGQRNVNKKAATSDDFLFS